MAIPCRPGTSSAFAMRFDGGQKVRTSTRRARRLGMLRRPHNTILASPVDSFGHGAFLIPKGLRLRMGRQLIVAALLFVGNSFGQAPAQAPVRLPLGAP